MEDNRLQLLRDWLACSDEASRCLWFDSGLLSEYRNKALRVGWDHLQEIRRRGMFVSMTPEEMEVFADRLLFDKIIFGRLKPPAEEKPGKTPDFPTLGQFYRYLNLSLNGIKDLINDDVREKGQTSPLETEEGEGSSEKEIPINLDPEIILSIQQRLWAAEELLQAFRSRLEGMRGLQPHFDLLLDAHKGVAEEVINFLDAPRGTHHTEIRDLLEERGTSQSKYNSYNRRLQHEWRQFREEEPGKNLWLRLVETQK